MYIHSVQHIRSRHSCKGSITAKKLNKSNHVTILIIIITQPCNGTYTARGKSWGMRKEFRFMLIQVTVYVVILAVTWRFICCVCTVSLNWKKLSENLGKDVFEQCYKSLYQQTQKRCTSVKKQTLFFVFFNLWQWFMVHFSHELNLSQSVSSPAIFLKAL